MFMPYGEYIIATEDNPFHINIRNILNPSGYSFMGRCSDSGSLIRMIRQSTPDFFIADNTINQRELKTIIDTVDDEMLCSCIIASEYKSIEIEDLIQNSVVVSYCVKPIVNDVFLSVVEMTLLNFQRVKELNKKIKTMNETLATRTVVDKAKLLLMKKMKITEDAAYKIIRSRSMNTRASMKEVADAIILIEDMNWVESNKFVLWWMYLI